MLKDMCVKNFGIHAFLASNTVTNEYQLSVRPYDTAVEDEQKAQELDLDIEYQTSIPEPVLILEEA